MGQALSSTTPSFSANAAKKSYKLSYFDVRGQAEVIRLIFALTGTPYEEERYAMEFVPGQGPQYGDEYKAAKEAGTFGANLNRVPILTVDGSTVLGQSRAIERYLARELGLLGRTSLEAAQADAFVEHIMDLRTAFSKVRFASPEDKAKEMEAYASGPLPTMLKAIEEVTPEGGAIVPGAGITLADLFVYNFATQFMGPRPGHLFDEETGLLKALSECPKLSAVAKNVGQNEKIAAYVANRKQTML